MQILHEEKDFIIIDKPAGVVTHPDGKRKPTGITLSEQVVALYPEMSRIDAERPGVVHRLDTETSGVMIFARTKKFAEYIKEQFQNHGVQKEYKAFVWGWFKDESKKGVINAAIGRSKSDFRQYSADRFARGDMREATTLYEVVGEFETDKLPKTSITPRFSYISLQPKTGRTHQIRVHMKYINHVIVADSLYAPAHPHALGFTRQALHAHSVTFNDLKNKSRTFVSPLPKDFQEAVDTYVVQSVV